MTSLIAVCLVHAAATTPAPDAYADAYRQAIGGRPLVVLVSTQWCLPCQKMKKEVIPEVQRRGLFKDVAFTMVNPDQDAKLAMGLTGGSRTIPQLIIYRKTATGWKRRRLVGGQSVEQVENFIRQGTSTSRLAKRGKAQSNAPGE